MGIVMSARARRLLVLTHSAVTAACVLLLGAGDIALAQTTLPKIEVEAPKQAQKRAPAARKQAARRPAAPAPAPAPAAATPSPGQQVATKSQGFDRARDETILPKSGTSTYTIDRTAIEALPQGTETPVDKVLLQAPGVTQDSAASGLLHVRNEHANVQYRINGILLPDGVAGFGQVLDSGFIGSLSLITGALPAQYGLHTAALVDIVTKTQPAQGEGAVSVYGGGRQTLNSSIQYGGVIGQTEYFFIGRYLTNGEGIENPAPTLNAIHDVTHQDRFFGYTSTILDDTTRLVTMSGAFTAKFQIPNNPGQSPVFCSDPTICPTNTIMGFDAGNTFSSSALNENQVERNYFGVVAVQKKVDDLDLQLAYFTRYSSVHFLPDVIGDLAFNGIASDVYRSSFVNGLQGDAAYRVNDAHTLRYGMVVTGEYTQVTNNSEVFGGGFIGGDPTAGPCFAAMTCDVLDTTGKFGMIYGTYVQDEWRITNRLTLNAGLRFDEMVQFITANQLSPRASLTYKPWDNTTFHIGYARTFTPPSQVIATPANYNLFNNTSGQAAINANPSGGAPLITQSGPVLPERANVYDAGVVQKFGPTAGATLELGLDAYYKTARDLLDDGQFGQALVLSGFNYDRGENIGVEGKAVITDGNLRLYGNLAWARQLATDIVSNQFLFAPADLAFIAQNWIYTDHTQIWTASSGASYLWNGTRVSADMTFGSGLRNGAHNSSHLPAYYQINTGISHEFQVPWGKPFTLRFDVVNILDQVYELRDGTGIGVFAPQFGPRRTYLVGLSQKI
jgi:outer membrane receptor protein involved in Fe transport